MGFQGLLLLFVLLCAFRRQLMLPVSDICTLTNRSLTCIGIRSQNDFPIVLPFNSNATSAIFVGTKYLLDFPYYPFEHTSWQYLQKLELQNFVRIKSLDENTFLGLWNLKELRITNFTILWKIDRSSLLVLPKLEILDFGHNVNLSFFSIEDLIENTVPNLRQLFLSHLNNAADTPNVIGKSFISAIGTKNLTHLDLSGAKINLIKQNVMESTFANLRYLNLSDTGISWMNTFLFWLPNLETLDITRTQYIYTKTGNITNLPGKSLKRIYANEMIFDDSINNNYSVTINADGGIPLELIMIRKFRAPITAHNITCNGLFHNVSILDLSDGNISYLSHSMLQTFPSLKIAILGGNMLGKMENTTEFGDLFNNNYQLQQVSLAKNGIRKLPEDIFGNNAMLLVIDLHGNHLTNFNINLTRQSNIRYLDLSENNLRNISKSLIDVLESHFETQSGQSIDVFTCKNLSKVESDFNQDSCQQLQAPQNLTLNLAGNPFECDCDNIYFIEWISNTKIDLASKHSLKCSFVGNNLTMCAESLQFIKSKCKGSSTIAPGATMTIVTIGVIVSVVFLVFVVLAVMIWKKKIYCVQEQESDTDEENNDAEELVPSVS
ncbi:hypothetical protein CHS0354_023697 [Potamilus streckersoni]|uniref:Uncharacterized protein n=1 Tax=Potamilus streckersoni TaxID=2493646 RepID=A0AAE0SBF2_9BIVA|nr:hypothetical protein CHS0354_023697 [Potamilus streckersoni]